MERPAWGACSGIPVQWQGRTVSPSVPQQLPRVPLRSVQSTGLAQGMMLPSAAARHSEDASASTATAPPAFATPAPPASHTAAAAPAAAASVWPAGVLLLQQQQQQQQLWQALLAAQACAPTGFLAPAARGQGATASLSPGAWQPFQLHPAPPGGGPVVTSSAQARMQLEVALQQLEAAAAQQRRIATLEQRLLVEAAVLQQLEVAAVQQQLAQAAAQHQHQHQQQLLLRLAACQAPHPAGAQPPAGAAGRPTSPCLPELAAVHGCPAGSPTAPPSARLPLDRQCSLSQLLAEWGPPSGPGDALEW